MHIILKMSSVDPSLDDLCLMPTAIIAANLIKNMDNQLGSKELQTILLTFFVLPISKIVSSFSLSLFVPFPPALFPELGLFARTMAGKARIDRLTLNSAHSLCSSF